MIPEDRRERMRRSSHLEKKRLCQIAPEEHCSRETLKKVVFATPPQAVSVNVTLPYSLHQP